MLSGILIKIHKSYRWVVAICDSNLIGRTLEEGVSYLDISERFFKGDEYDFSGLKEIIYDCIREDSTFYIVGERSVSLAREIGLIVEDGVLTINGVPFALSLL